MASRTQVREMVRAPGFLPKLREDVRFLKGPSDDIVVVLDERTNSPVEMYAMDCVIAKAMNGSRDLDAIARHVRPSVPMATRDQIEKIVLQIAGMGLLQGITIDRMQTGSLATPPPPPIRPPAPPRVTTPAPPAPDEFDEQTAVGSSASLRAIEDFGDEELDDSPLPGRPLDDSPLPGRPLDDSPLPGRPLDDSPLPGRPLDDSPLPGRPLDDSPLPGRPLGNAPGFSSRDDESIENLATQADTGEEFNLGAPRPAEQSQGDDWDVARTEFYRQKWFRRVWKIGIFVAIIAALAFIPYPIYVNDECSVLPSKRADVRAEIEGILNEILVDEGDLVEKGQVLARLDGRDLSYELKRAQADVDRLQANASMLQAGSRPEEIRQAKTKVSSARKDLAISSKQYRRAKALFKNNVGSKSALEDAAGEVQMRSQALKEATASLRLVEAGFRSEEVKIAEAELRQAEADVMYLEKKLTLLELRAPIAGRVLTPKFREKLHQKVAAGDNVIEIGDALKVRIEISVAEEDADIIALGQKVSVKVHSYPLDRFTGVIAFVAPRVEERDGNRVIRVDAEIDNAEGKLLPRMTGYAEIYTGDSSVLHRVSRKVVRWVRVRFLI